MKSFTTILLTAATLNAAAAASTQAAMTSEDATQLIKESIAEAVEVLSDPELQGKEHRVDRHLKLRGLSNKIFNWGAMAQRSLGPHWRGLNQDQRERFKTVFKEILAAHYLTQLDSFQGEERVVHEGTEPAGDGYQVKMTLITASRSTVPLNFFVNPDLKVYDVAIEGVSLTNHFRGSFNRLLVNGDFESMMKQLERKLAVQKRIEAQAQENPSET
ncbi:MAG: phospholipid-binding protein MlaC [Myxococcota bacterium]